jgi:hypothetical protein
MPDPTPLFTVISGTCQWGVITSDGSLGYKSDIANNRVVAASIEEFDQILSAHAKSDVTIELHAPAVVQGFIAASTSGDPCNPVLFTIDFNSVGMAWQPLDATEAIRLPRGTYRLRCLSRNKPNGLHSAWGFRRVPEPIPSALQIITVGRYPLEVLDWTIAGLTRSATRFGRLVKVCDPGEPMGSWPLCKLEATLQVVRELPDHITHILFCDGCDCMVLGEDQELIKRFQQVGADFAISMERICWPISDDREWKTMFPEVPGRRRFPNSGMWMGTREATVRVLEECLVTYRQVKEDNLPPSLRKWQRHAKWADRSDQWMFQLTHFSERVPIHLDSRYDLFANMGPDCRLLENNPDYELDAGRLRALPEGTHPLVIHFAGGCTGKSEWQARLGTLRGPARPGCKPAGAEVDPYLTRNRTD